MRPTQTLSRRHLLPQYQPARNRTGPPTPRPRSDDASAVWSPAIPPRPLTKLNSLISVGYGSCVLLMAFHKSQINHQSQATAITEPKSAFPREVLSGSDKTGQSHGSHTRVLVLASSSAALMRFGPRKTAHRSMLRRMHQAETQA